VTLLDLRGREGAHVVGPGAALEGQAPAGREQHRTRAQHAAHVPRAWGEGHTHTHTPLERFSPPRIDRGVSPVGLEPLTLAMCHAIPVEHS